jgi:hypothetical protein
MWSGGSGSGTLVSATILLQINFLPFCLSGDHSLGLHDPGSTFHILIGGPIKIWIQIRKTLTKIIDPDTAL